MFSHRVLPALTTLFACIQASSTFPAASSTFYSNTSRTTSTLTSSSGQITPSVCCFVIQDTATANYWPITSLNSTSGLVNLTSVTTYVTPFVNGTVSNIVTNTYLVNTTYERPYDIGKNPLEFFLNGASPFIHEYGTEIATGVTAVTTGGVTVQSPAAFFVYSTLKILTAAPVTNTGGVMQCGTQSSFTAKGFASVTPTFANINSNAEAFFQGSATAGNTAEKISTTVVIVTITSDHIVMLETTTEYLNAGSTLPVVVEDGILTEIVLPTPFIFQPAIGANGSTATGTCFQGDESELYGYVPQTLVNFVGAQYPQFASCLPGGPSMLPEQSCSTASSYTVQTGVGGNLSRSTVITVTPAGGLGGPTTTPTPPPTSTEDKSNGASPGAGGGAGGPNTVVQSVGASNTPQGGSGGGGSGGEGGQGGPAAGQVNTSPPVSQTPPASQSIGAIVNSMIGGDPAPGAGQGGSGGQGGGSSGGSGGSGGQGGSGPQGGGGQPGGSSGGSGGSGGQGGSGSQGGGGPAGGGGGSGGQSGNSGQSGGSPASFITPPPGQPITITGSTTIPLANAPPGLQGSTTVIGGSSFVVVPGPTTIAPAAGAAIPVSLGSTTFISGTPFFVIPTATTAPAAGLPAGIGSTTIINGTPFVVIQPTKIPVPAGSGSGGQIFSTMTVNGTPFLFIPGPTSIPVAGAPAGVTGSVTTINGTPFFVIPSATSVPALPGHVTIISGSTFDVFDGATTVPVNPNLPLGGSLTVISGTTMVQIPGATTVPVLPGSLTLISGTLLDVFTGPTTVPVNAELPLTGQTTVISGTTMVIIPGATTVPVLPGSLTLISGTLYDVFSGPTTVPVNPELPLSGQTTVISGTTMVILPGATTVPVKVGAGSSPSSSFVQVSGAGRRGSWIGFVIGLIRGFMLRFR